jgi:dipeptidyl-peptidase-4
VERFIGRRREWFDPRTGRSSPPDVEPDAGPDRETVLSSLRALAGIDERTARRALSPPTLEVSSDGAVRLTSAVERLFVHGAIPSHTPPRCREIVLPGGAPDLPRLAPDGRTASVRAGRQLHLIDLASATSRAISEDGSDDVLYGRLDWVYQEEVYGRGRWSAQWWSPDGEHLAYLRIDQTAVPRHPVIDQTAHHPAVQETRHPKAGDPNPIARLFVVSRSGAPVAVDLAAYDASVLIVDVGFVPDGRVVFQVQDRTQTWLDLCVADAATGRTTRLLRETSPTWVNAIEAPRWLPDGTFLWQSERTGQQHVYRYAADGKLLCAVTAGDWSVRRIVDV